MSTLGLDGEPVYVHERMNAPKAQSALVACPDCQRSISHRAVSCPACGVRLQPWPEQQPTVIRIAGGIILGYFGILIINAILAFVLFLFFAGALASSLQNLPQSPSIRSR